MVMVFDSQTLKFNTCDYKGMDSSPLSTRELSQRFIVNSTEFKDKGLNSDIWTLVTLLSFLTLHHPTLTFKSK